MSPTRFFRHIHVGRTTLWRGAPLRIAVWAEPAATVPFAMEAAVSPLVNLRVGPREEEDAKAEREQQQELTTFQLEPGRTSIELSTANVPANEPLEVSLRVDASAMSESVEEQAIQAAAVPEAIWVLERDDYQELVDEQLQEDFLPSYGLPAEQVPGLVADLMHELLPMAMVRQDFAERLEARLAGEEEEPASAPQPHGLWPFEFTEHVVPGEAPFPEDPVRWVAAKLIAIVSDLLVNGFDAPPKVAVVADAKTRTVTLTFELSLAEPISEELAQSLTDAELSDLTLIQQGAKPAEVAETIQPGATEVRIGCSLPTAGFPLDEATT